MSAEDYDDPEEGGNADIVYTIEKNEMKEETGLLIFEIDSSTGATATGLLITSFRSWLWTVEG
ncbi:hypothetical protein J6590_063104 [Homalodisca vitripennis]|nr:hypothetical protein J6590_063104 [Homalodisca vitripennis]